MDSLPSWPEDCAAVMPARSTTFSTERWDVPPSFTKPTDYAAFEKVLRQAWERLGTRLLAYTVLPNHWHLVLWPREDGELSRSAQWVTVTHVRRWHVHHHTVGTGPVY
jgi:putative transposase